MNYFRQNPFYDYDARMAKLAEVSREYPREDYKLATTLAALVRENSDVTKIETLCRRIRTNGKGHVTSAIKKITALAPNSTKRKFEYVEELLG
jgi:hypothetical protein